MTDALSPLLWFVAVIALIPVALWLLRRTPVGAAASTGPMRTISTLPISGNQRLLTVEVGRGDDRLWLVLGVTAQQITTLHTMAPQQQALPDVNPQQTAFAQLLQRMRQGGDGTQGQHAR